MLESSSFSHLVSIRKLQQFLPFAWPQSYPVSLWAQQDILKFISSTLKKGNTRKIAATHKKDLNTGHKNGTNDPWRFGSANINKRIKSKLDDCLHRSHNFLVQTGYHGTRGKHCHLPRESNKALRLQYTSQKQLHRSS